MRNLLFVSHANPEDNIFSRWIALQLAKEGYGVWCDQTRLLGGEDFWADIEEVIREHACKLLYVLSVASNHKPGPLQELHVAQTVARREGLRDFIIPLRIDNTLAYSDINIQLARINAIDFTAGWATGLHTLLKKLQQDGVQKDARYSPASVTAWWQSQFGSHLTVRSEPEEYLSNWFSIRQLPQMIFLHAVHPSYSRTLRPQAFPYAVRRHRDYIASFASVADLASGLSDSSMIRSSYELATEALLEGITDPILVRPIEGRNIVLDLLRRGWEGFFREAGMSTYTLGRRGVAGYIRDGVIEGNRVKIPGSARRPRQIVGYRARKDSEGRVIGHTFWHFAIEGRPMLHPIRAFRIVPHVLFSSDGQRIWSNKRRLHRVRRRECKNWWNPEWRDRTLGLMNWLSREQEVLRLRFGSKCEIEVSALPEVFSSPVSYKDPEVKPTLPPDAVDVE